MVHTGSHPGESSVAFMPMIDLKANDETYIFSTKHFFVGQAKKYNADPKLTFDLPLYQKVYETLWKESENSELKRIVLRLSGLRTCMRFLGSIGHFMSSSGLREVLETIYGSDTVPHMLSDSAISRAFWGHLVSGVLYATIISDVYECPLHDQFSAEDSKKDLFTNTLPKSKLGKVSQVFDQLKEQNISLEKIANGIDVNEMLASLSQYKEKFSEARTVKLWFQYLRMVEIISMFIKAERTGNFDFPLQSVWAILPYFAASVHHLYARSAHIYLQTMQNLEVTNKKVYKRFENGYHVVLRSQRFLRRLSTDLIVEQVTSIM